MVKEIPSVAFIVPVICFLQHCLEYIDVLEQPKNIAVINSISGSLIQLLQSVICTLQIYNTLPLEFSEKVKINNLIEYIEGYR